MNLTIPLMRKHVITDEDQTDVDVDVQYLAKLVCMANKQGLEGRRITSLIVTPNKEQTGTVFTFGYEDHKS